jgi:aspartate carbamoyltransferase catalytic subunit
MRRNLLSSTDLSRADLLELVSKACLLQHGLPPNDGFVAGLFFFEASTRTRMGFEAAVARLGGTSVSLTAPKQTGNMSGAETWQDTLRSVGSYFDVVCVRSSDVAAPETAASILDGTAVINCGNGSADHPSQGLIDLFAIFGHLGAPPDGMRAALVGDLLGMRAAHSLLAVLGKFKQIQVHGISPAQLQAPERYVRCFESGKGNAYIAGRSLSGLGELDILYMAGFAPVTPAGAFADDARWPFAIDAESVLDKWPRSGILCPLPRIDEIAKDVDDLPNAKYFWQSQRAVYMRMAIIDHCLGLPRVDR